MGTHPRPVRLAAATLAILAVWGGEASAGRGGWSAPRSLGTVNGFATAPAVAPNGDAIVAMTDYSPSGSSVLTAERRRGRWGPARVIRRSRHELFDAAAAYGPGSTPVVAWLRAVRLDQVQFVEMRTGGGPVRVVSPTDGRALFPSLVAGAAGRLVLAWADRDYALHVGDPPGTDQPIFDRMQFSYEVGLDGAGTTVAMAHAFGAHGVRVRVHPPGGAWGAEEVVSGARSAREPDLAVSRDGTVAVAWAQSTITGYRLQVALRPPGGTFGAAQTFADAPGEARAPAISFLPDGTLLVAFVAGARPDWLLRGRELRLSTVRPGAAPAPSVRVATGRLSDPPRLLTDSQGDALLTWSDRHRLMSVVRAASGKVGRVEQISAGATLPEVVASERGDAIAVWASAPGRRPSISVAERRF